MRKTRQTKRQKKEQVDVEELKRALQAYYETSVTAAVIFADMVPVAKKLAEIVSAMNARKKKTVMAKETLIDLLLRLDQFDHVEFMRQHGVKLHDESRFFDILKQLL